VCKIKDSLNQVIEQNSLEISEQIEQIIVDAWIEQNPICDELSDYTDVPF
jgi:hypothetical protein